ncbi:MAG TPA: HAMP domain-containing sensor histidine kinase [Flavobacterium sp.]|nr:HAMP domain-containing sensor histidine kinase [Flavobacterium sp.]
MRIANRIKLRYIIILFSLGILCLILWNTYQLFQTFKQEERVKMEIWAKAYKGINLADEHTDVEFQTFVISQNTTIPIAMVNPQGVVEMANVDEKIMEDDELKERFLNQLKAQNPPIEVDHPDGTIYIYYGNSSLVNKLKYYPLALISILILFGGLVYSYFRTNRISAENRLWAGMAKETAHQIGTPLSSLLGWIELMKLQNVDEQIVDEVGKDVERLQVIADRFSKIGSVPVLEKLNIVEATQSALTYLSARSSKQIEFSFSSNSSEIWVNLNPALHHWTIENLVKNAIDAIKGKGKINVEITTDKNYVTLSVTDNGKGMAKNQFKKIFEPGFTTKKRGWGLGLSLTKRIVQDYHKGKIRVVQSVPFTETVFAIVYPVCE